MRLAARIRQLRELGHPIVMRYITVITRTGKPAKVAEYRMGVAA